MDLKRAYDSARYNTECWMEYANHFERIQFVVIDLNN